MSFAPRRDQAASKPQTTATLGDIIAVSGSKATIGILASALGPDDPRTTVSKFVMIHSGRSQLIGLVTEIALNLPPFAIDQGYRATAELDLMGEISTDYAGTVLFRRGVSDYPAIGDSASLLNSDEFRLVYRKSAAASGVIGRLHQDPSIEAYINVNELLNKHFAVLGSTGVGKSCGVAAILHQVLGARPDLRILLLDAHNEYGKCFGEAAQVLNPRNLKLPFWLFNFEEIVDVIFGARSGIDEEIVILSEVIPLAKNGYLRYRGPAERSALKRTDASSVAYTADTPVPYVLADMVNLIDERMGKLENRAMRATYHKLMSRIETVRNDPRYAFMFDNANVGGDTLAEVLTQLFRLIPNGKPMTVMQLAGFPAEVVDAVVSVLGRMAFDFGLWSDGASPLLFVCEEAHRYAPSDRKIGFGPTRRAFSRIAKEGRKYGVFLGLVTQRPAELDATILAQCGTLFVMRMSNDRDQAILRSAVSDAAANLVNFVPSLGTREVFAFGEGLALPTRLTFQDLPQGKRPQNEAIFNWRIASGAIDQEFIASVIERWRGTMSGGRLRLETAPIEALAQAPIPQNPVSLSRTAPGLDVERFSILKKKAPAGKEPSGVLRSDQPPQAPQGPAEPQVAGSLRREQSPQVPSAPGTTSLVRRSPS
jgi:DNA helicase HerA-like ATPase